VRKRTYRPCRKRHDVTSNGQKRASTIASPRVSASSRKDEAKQRSQ